MLRSLVSGGVALPEGSCCWPVGVCTEATTTALVFSGQPVGGKLSPEPDCSSAAINTPSCEARADFSLLLKVCSSFTVEKRSRREARQSQNRVWATKSQSVSEQHVLKSAAEHGGYYRRGLQHGALRFPAAVFPSCSLWSKASAITALVWSSR